VPSLQFSTLAHAYFLANEIAHGSVRIDHPQRRTSGRQLALQLGEQARPRDVDVRPTGTEEVDCSMPLPSVQSRNDTLRATQSVLLSRIP